MVKINSVTNEVETSDAEAFFVDGIIVKWLVVGDISDTNHSIVGIKIAGFAEVEGIIARNDDDFFAIRKFIIKVATKIGIFCSIGSGGTHLMF